MQIKFSNKIQIKLLDKDSWEVQMWQSNRRKVLKDLSKGWQIDGIDQAYAGRVSYTTATTNL